MYLTSGFDLTNAYEFLVNNKHNMEQFLKNKVIKWVKSIIHGNSIICYGNFKRVTV